jgi:CheY-like chemotaxis protein
MTNARILVVEDDLDQVLLLKRAFTQVNILDHIRIASDREEAISYLSEETGDESSLERFPALVLLDLNLPRISGLEVTRLDARLAPLQVDSGGHAYVFQQSFRRLSSL